MAPALSRFMERTDLEARTAAFAAAAFQLASLIRLKPGGRHSADQLLDCATSIGANYRASARARSRDEFIAKLGMVNEEADEAVYWLEFIRNVQLGDAADGKRIAGRSEAIARDLCDIL